ncbi:MAG: hypothetical protein ACYC4J_07150, partial [Gemmatimonadaceae bacterium]
MLASDPGGELELAVEVDQVAGEDALNDLDPVGKDGVGARGEELCLPRDGQVGVEFDEVASGGGVAAALLHRIVSGVSIGDGGG